MNTDDILLLKTYDKRISIFYRIKEELRRSWSVLMNRQQIGIDICNNNYTNKNTTTIKNELSLLKSSITIKPHYYICRFTDTPWNTINNIIITLKTAGLQVIGYYCKLDILNNNHVDSSSSSNGNNNPNIGLGLLSHLTDSRKIELTLAEQIKIANNCSNYESGSSTEHTNKNMKNATVGQLHGILGM